MTKRTTKTVTVVETPIVVEMTPVETYNDLVLKARKMGIKGLAKKNLTIQKSPTFKSPAVADFWISAIRAEMGETSVINTRPNWLKCGVAFEKNAPIFEIPAAQIGLGF